MSAAIYAKIANAGNDARESRVKAQLAEQSSDNTLNPGLSEPS
jgi:hypothetical protein